MESEIRCENEPEDIYSLCGCDKDGKALCVDFGKDSRYEIYLLDEKHNAELIDTTNNLTFTVKPNFCIMIKEVC